MIYSRGPQHIAWSFTCSQQDQTTKGTENHTMMDIFTNSRVSKARQTTRELYHPRRGQRRHRRDRNRHFQHHYLIIFIIIFWYSPLSQQQCSDPHHRPDCKARSSKEAEAASSSGGRGSKAPRGRRPLQRPLCRAHQSSESLNLSQLHHQLE